MDMSDDKTNQTRPERRPRAGGKVKRLFDSPYLIDSPEAPADLSHIGNGRGHLIDEAVEELIQQVPEDQNVPRPR